MLSGLEGFDDCVVHDRAQPEAALLGDQVHAFRQQGNRDLTVEIDPKRGSGEAQVPHGIL